MNIQMQHSDRGAGATVLAPDAGLFAVCMQGVVYALRPFLARGGALSLGVRAALTSLHITVHGAFALINSRGLSSSRGDQLRECLSGVSSWLAGPASTNFGGVSQCGSRRFFVGVMV